MIDYTITAGNIIEGISFVLVAAAFVFKRDSTITYMSNELSELKVEIKKLAGVLTGLAVTDLKINNVEGDVREIRHDIREMRHGRGFIRESLDKEWAKDKPRS